MLTNSVDVDCWRNIDVECRQEAKKIVDLHFARTPTPSTLPVWKVVQDIHFIYLFQNADVKVDQCEPHIPLALSPTVKRLCSWQTFNS